MADQAIRRGAPAKFAWYISFGLLVTMVWLYLEILRLLSYIREQPHEGPVPRGRACRTRPGSS